MKLTNKNILVIFILMGVMYFVFTMMSSSSGQNEQPFSDFLERVKRNSISEAFVKGNKVIYRTSDQGPQVSVIPDGMESDLSKILFENGVRYRYQKQEEPSALLMIFSSWLPVLIIIGVMLFFSRQLQSGGNKLMGIGRFKPKVPNKQSDRVTFNDVAGIDDAKEELQEIVDYLKAPAKFSEIGGKIPTGVLLTGSPGTGKTLLARAVAGEAEVAFFSISGSDFVEMFVGVGASRVRDLFQQARQNAPCIIFIDEIDAVGRHRGHGMGGGNDEREQTLNQLLVEMDGFNQNEGIIILASTNRPDVLDPALLRPGRFDRQVVVSPPDFEGRKKILAIHSKNVKLAKDVDIEKLAGSTAGFTGADLANLINEAALLSGRRKKANVGNQEFEDARDKITMGVERKTYVMRDEEKRATSYHEAGHALITALSKFLDPVHKVTIVPRGKALGFMMQKTERDSFSTSKGKLMEMLEMLMGGRVAEELVFNHFTTGASNDLERATNLAQKMVCSWGMTKNVGPVYLSMNNDGVFVGREMQSARRFSNKLIEAVDAEVKKIVNDAYLSAKQKIKDNIHSLHKIADVLLKQETIDGQQVTDIIQELSGTQQTTERDSSNENQPAPPNQDTPPKG